MFPLKSKFFHSIKLINRKSAELTSSFYLKFPYFFEKSFDEKTMMISSREFFNRGNLSFEKRKKKFKQMKIGDDFEKNS